jgi:hypothetical protein
MGPALLHCLILAPLLCGAPSSDTTTYADRATQQLVARAMARHLEQDSSVHDYTAKLRYRVSFGFARRKWGDPLPVAVEEQDATLSWQLPNDLRVDMLGRRSASQLQGVDLSSTFAHPWFVPRTLGDSLRIFGASQTPSRAAPHPLARGADRFYRYAAGDSVIITNNARRITIQSVTITPKHADGAYVAGRIWLDLSTGDVVRFTFRFVGTELWVDTSDVHNPKDSASAVRDSKFVSQIVELNADLEYSLQDNTHWMPYRQVIAGKVSMPFGVDFAVPFEAKTTFDDYSVNSGKKVIFDAAFPRDTNARGRNGGRFVAGGGGGRGRAGGPPPNLSDSARRRVDSLRRADTSAFRSRFRNRTGYLPGGGKYEIHRPPPDSMRNYSGWSDSLVLQESDVDRRRLQQAMSDLAHITAALPPEMTGRPGIGIAWEKVSDILRYNRVEGTTLSIGGRVPLPGSFADLFGTVRYGFADQRVMARIAAVRDAPGGRLIVAGMRDLVDIDAFSQGLTFGNSLRGIFTGHDDGAYLLAQGGRLSFETSAGRGTEMMISALAEDERSVTSEARAFFPRIVGTNGYFPATDSVREGFASGAGIRLDHAGLSTRWMLDGEGLVVAGQGAARLAAEFRFQRLAAGWATVRIKGGLALGADSVPQLALRAGGINTVRGYDFGTETGDALWAAQLDVSRPSRSAVKVVGFIDAGEAGFRSNFGAAKGLSGAGVGISVLGGFIRAELSHPITETQGRGFRFDLVFGGAR